MKQMKEMVLMKVKEAWLSKEQDIIILTVAVSELWWDKDQMEKEVRIVLVLSIEPVKIRQSMQTSWVINMNYRQKIHSFGWIVCQVMFHMISIMVMQHKKNMVYFQLKTSFR